MPKKGYKQSLEHRTKISIAGIGEKNHFYGRKHSSESIKKMSISMLGVNYGIKRSYDTRMKIRRAKLADNNPNWKGNNIDYHTLHMWVRRNLSKPDTCEICNKNPPAEASNISQEYYRDLNDWQWLCLTCHKMSHMIIRISLYEASIIANNFGEVGREPALLTSLQSAANVR